MSESMTSLSKSQQLASKLIRAKMERDLTGIFAGESGYGYLVLDDTEAVAIKRIAQDRYLDFPHVLRGRHISGALNLRAEISKSPLGKFFSYLTSDQIFLFLEPWAIRGVVLINTSLLTSRLDCVMEYCDGSAKIYDVGLGRSFVIEDDDDGMKFSALL